MAKLTCVSKGHLLRLNFFLEFNGLRPHQVRLRRRRHPTLLLSGRYSLMEGTLWSWVTLFLLGAFHGINPGMGWLFAVALGMQEGSRRAVWRALLPLGIGHALAIAAVILLAVLLGVMVPLPALRVPVALTLMGTGVYRLARHCQPRLGGMRVGMVGLTAWSFLMASAHGAGLMVLPVFST